MTSTTPPTTTKDAIPALVFGASGEQGRAVIEGLVESGYSPVYGFTRLQRDDACQEDAATARYLQDALGCTLWKGDLANPDDVGKALTSTRAQAIFFVTTTELPSEIGQTTGCWNAMEAEYEVIQCFFERLVQVHQQDGLKRHVIFSTKDNVQQLCRLATNGEGTLKDITPLDDGSIVPHYSAKGRGAEFALKLLQQHEDLTLTLVTLPFVYSNFLGFFTPLPVAEDTDNDNTTTDGTTSNSNTVNQWQINASLGDGEKPLDMMSVSDLSIIVPHILEQPDTYKNQNIRLSACRVSMDDIAAAFSDLFGKDVIYNPLLPEEVAALPFPSAPAMAQMCHYLQHSQPHSLELTQQVMFPRQPQSFKDWLLTHSDSTAFVRVGLDLDAPEITSVVVFGATSPQGISVIKGLLADTRKQYTVRAAINTTTDTTGNSSEAAVQAIQALDPERVEIVHADLDNVQSCQAAAEGVDGAFLVTDFYKDANRNMEREEQHAKNVIDACEAAHSIKHLVFSTMDNVEEINKVMDLGLSEAPDSQGQSSTLVQMDAKAKAAAYARTKKLSVTYVILPCYSEMFLDMIQPARSTTSSTNTPPPSDASCGDDNKDNNKNGGGDGGGDDQVTTKKKQKLVLTVPLKNSNAKVMCMSIDDLGPAVSNIFDSYQVFAGHEIGLVTDFVTVSEIRDMLNAVILEDQANGTAAIIETETVTKEDWVEMKESDTYMKDLGQMFAYLSHTDAVKKRHSIARTMKLVPSARPLKLWVEQNKDNPAFREKLGLR